MNYGITTDVLRKKKITVRLGALKVVPVDTPDRKLGSGAV